MPKGERKKFKRSAVYMRRICGLRKAALPGSAGDFSRAAAAAGDGTRKETLPVSLFFPPKLSAGQVFDSQTAPQKRFCRAARLSKKEKSALSACKSLAEFRHPQMTE